MKILYREIASQDSRKKYLWSWESSYEADVFGVAASLGDIKRKAATMFPGDHLVFICF